MKNLKLKILVMISIILALILINKASLAAPWDSFESIEPGSSLARDLDLGDYDYLFCAQYGTRIITTNPSGSGFHPKAKILKGVNYPKKRFDFQIPGGMDTSNVYQAVSTYTSQEQVKMTPMVAYIFTIAGKYRDKNGSNIDYKLLQSAIWNSDMNQTSAWSWGGYEGRADQFIVEANLYADFYKKVQGDYKPKSLIPKEQIKVGTDQTTQTYKAGPFKIDYAKGEVDSKTLGEVIHFGRIVDMYLVTDKGRIELKVIGKTDENKYPEPNEEFFIEFLVPHGTKKATLKVDLEYMLLEGDMTEHKGRTDQYQWMPDGQSPKRRWCYDDDTDTYSKPEKGSKCENCGSRRSSHTYEKRTYYTLKKVGDIPAQSFFEVDIATYGVKVEIKKDSLEIELPDKPNPFEMEIGGTVWLDGEEGKNSDYDSSLGSADAKFPGMVVELYEKGGSSPLKTTATDASGNYSFKDLDTMKKYYVVFKYNGVKFEHVNYMEGGEAYMGAAWNKNSKATETPSDRTALNNRFKEIGSYPNSYSGTGSLGYGVNTKVFTDIEMKPIYEKIYSYLSTDPTGNAKAVYNRIVSESGGDSEIRNKLQFWEDCQISAYTGSSGKNNIKYYPVYEKFTVKPFDEEINGEIYKAIYEGQKQIHFGVKGRNVLELALRKDVYEAAFKIKDTEKSFTHNRKSIEDGTFKVEQRDQTLYNMTYDQAVKKEDYEWRYDNYLGTTPFNIENELKVFVIHKITVRNISEIQKVNVTEIVDYYDSDLTFDYAPTSSWYTKASAKNSTKQVIWKQKSKYGNEKAFTGVTSMYTDTLNTENLISGDFITIFVKFEVKKDQDNRIKMDEGKKGKINVAEINGYRTDIGIVDRASKPGNAVPGNPATYENDADSAPYFKLIFDLLNINKIAGNVWEDEKTAENTLALKLKDNNTQRIADGKKNDNETKMIENVKVQLYEIKIDDQGKEIELMKGTSEDWTTRTDAQGKYEFSKVPVGTYRTKFTYGDSVQLKSNPKYNGQDYKSTTYAGDAKLIETREKQKVEVVFNIVTAFDMIGNNIIQAKAEAGVIAKELLSYEDVDLKIGIFETIGYNAQAKNYGNDVLKLSKDKAQVANAIKSLNATDNGYDLALGMNQATKQFSNDKSIKRILILLTEGRDEITPTIAEIERLRAEGIELVTIYYDKYMGATMGQHGLQVASHPSEIFGTPEKPRYGRVYSMNTLNTDDVLKGLQPMVTTNQVFEKNKSYAKDYWNYTQKSEVDRSGKTIDLSEYGRITGVKEYQTLQNKKAEDLKDLASKNEEKNNNIINTKMTAKSSLINIRTVHNNENTSNVNLGLEEREKTVIKTEISVEYVKITLNNGTVIIDTEKNIMDNVMILNNQDPVKRSFQINLDEEVMNGAMVTLKYKIKVLNNGQNDTVLAYATNGSEDLIKTTASQIYVYTDPSVVFRKDDNLDGNGKALWDSGNSGDLNILNQSIKDKVNIENEVNKEESKLVKAVFDNDLLKALKPNETAETMLTLSKLLSPQNYNSNEALNYINSVEITERVNGLGRRDYGALPGNYDPSGNPNEYDSSKTGSVMVIPPTGEQRIYYVLLGAVVLLAIGGLVLIKKKVIDKKKE